MLELSIATGKSRKTKVWANEKVSWPRMVKRLSEKVSTGESYKDYIALGETREGREKQAELKDRGGYVGAYLHEGARHPANIVHRQLITLDLDYAELDLWDNFSLYFGNAAVIHSTHKHSESTPRYRLIMPLDRKVNATEYEAIARRVAAELGMNLFDPTTFQPIRLMHWPTTSKDGLWEFHEQKGEPLNADKLLASYDNPYDISAWPKHEQETLRIVADLKHQGDPRTKPGLIGAFNRLYTVHEAIETFLPDVYEQTNLDDRYTYSEGSAGAGAIVYGEGADFLYSHHSTDPGCGLLLNAFDLVRVHKFGREDKDPALPVTKQPSYRLMNEFAAAIKAVAAEYGVARLSAADEFNDGYVMDPEQDNTWLGDLKLDRFQKYEVSTTNFEKILVNDPLLRGLKFDKFNLMPRSTGPLPWNNSATERNWTDKDDACLRHYLESRYGIYNGTKLQDALSVVFEHNAFHPITNYLSGIEWDGTERLDTMLIDYLGAEDTPFIRLATRKAFTAAVARVFRPGIKFDYMLTLTGKEGIGKSTLLGKMGGAWFSDTFLGVEGAKAYEQLWGVWILEVGELKGIRYAEIEAVKVFISKRTDRFRVAYGKRNDDYPRQNIFIGTTNDWSFLKDNNGNRRFWPVHVTDWGLLSLDDLPVDQLWAEAVMYYKFGEKLYFDKDIEQDARDAQDRHTEVDERQGVIQEYLSTLLPSDWDVMRLPQRRAYLADPEEIIARGEWPRHKLCVAEIWCEVFQAPLKEMTTGNTKYIHTILNNIPGWQKNDVNLTFPIYGKHRTYVPVKVGKRVNKAKK